MRVDRDGIGSFRILDGAFSGLASEGNTMRVITVMFGL